MFTCRRLPIHARARTSIHVSHTFTYYYYYYYVLKTVLVPTDRLSVRIKRWRRRRRPSHPPVVSSSRAFIQPSSDGTYYTEARIVTYYSNQRHYYCIILQFPSNCTIFYCLTHYLQRLAQFNSIIIILPST